MAVTTTKLQILQEIINIVRPWKSGTVKETGRYSAYVGRGIGILGWGGGQCMTCNGNKCKGRVSVSVPKFTVVQAEIILTAKRTYRLKRGLQSSK